MHENNAKALLGRQKWESILLKYVGIGLFDIAWSILGFLMVAPSSGLHWQTWWLSRHMNIRSIFVPGRHLFETTFQRPIQFYIYKKGNPHTVIINVLTSRSLGHGMNFCRSLDYISLYLQWRIHNFCRGGGLKGANHCNTHNPRVTMSMRKTML